MRVPENWMEIIGSFGLAALLFIGIISSGALDNLNQRLSQEADYESYFIVMLGALGVAGFIQFISISSASKISFCAGIIVAGIIYYNIATMLLGFGGLTITLLIELPRWQQRKFMERYGSYK